MLADKQIHMQTGSLSKDIVWSASLSFFIHSYYNLTEPLVSMVFADKSWLSCEPIVKIPHSLSVEGGRACGNEPTQEVKVHCVLLLFLQIVLRLVRDIMAASTEPSTLDVVTAIQRLSVEKTRELVFRLGVQDYVLDNIDIQYGGTTRNIKYVEAWLDRDTDASWGKLVSGLGGIGMNVLAKEVEFMYISKGEEAAVPTTSSAPLVSATPPPQLSVDTPAQLEAAPLPATVAVTTAPLHLHVTAVNPNHSTAVNMERVAEVKAAIKKFKDDFFELKFDAQISLSEKETQDMKFLARFREYLLELSVSERAIHVKFFHQRTNDIYEAESVRMIFNILREYCSYFNYDIIHHLVDKFCDAVLKKRMLDYRDSLESFEKTTSVDIFLCAVSTHQEGAVYKAFSRMVAKINKPASKCSLHEIRQLNESLARDAYIHPYSVFIESVAESSVLVVLRIPQSCVVWVGVAMTPDFMQAHHLTDVSIDGKDITFYQDKDYLVCYGCAQLFHYSGGPGC